MKEYLKKFMTLICTMIIIIGFSIHEIHALPYYDLKFEETSSKIVKGEYEKLGENISLDKDTKMTINIKKSYEPKVSIELNKDEEDAISQVYGSGWRKQVVINKKEDINVKGNLGVYVQLRPVYKEINGYLLQDYNSWNKKKKVKILIPIDAEYNLKTN
ncbi:hypothetical protein [Romboutsia sp.]|uniref:hypothetical protein n=1 Tax=Romboutsia sp. TaxID=1965302 RepID=UPI002D0937A6|nr:hypothetical protein [Romboutsia sp.]HSQ88411.1 hypothetical protein [Romboutsia sp.]